MDDVVNDALRIRLRDGRDLAGLLALFNEERFVRYASARGPFGSAGELEAWLSAISCAKRYETVAVLAGRTIGFAGLYVMGEGLEHSGWILIGVREAFQAHGVGARLLKTLLGAASVVFALRRVQLTVFGDNEPAMKLYRRFGFEIEGRHREFIHRSDGFIDGFTMARMRAPGAPQRPAA
jgi:putative acetyltransferase